jgi:hypothetical protein
MRIKETMKFVKIIFMMILISISFCGLSASRLPSVPDWLIGNWGAGRTGLIEITTFTLIYMPLGSYPVAFFITEITDEQHVVFRHFPFSDSSDYFEMIVRRSEEGALAHYPGAPTAQVNISINGSAWINMRRL